MSSHPPTSAGHLYQNSIEKEIFVVGVVQNKRVSDEVIREAYTRLKSVWAVGKEVGLCGQSVHERVKKLGFINEDAWTEQEIALLTRWYTERAFTAKDKFSLDDLAEVIGKLKSNVCRKAKELGLTNIHRKVSEEQCAKMGVRAKAWIAENGHPRGALGMKHTEQMKELMSARVGRMWAGECPTFVDGTSTFKGMQTRSKNGTLVRERTNTTWKMGKRKIGDSEIYFRSSWEFNYALFLELLKTHGHIARWEHEPDTYWFHGITRGARMYLPDFKIHLADGTFYYVEVKGWMNPTSKTKLARMAKTYPEHLVMLVEKKEMVEIQQKYRHLLPDWEGWISVPRKIKAPVLRLELD